jgi:hypothetical protein
MQVYTNFKCWDRDHLLLIMTKSLYFFPINAYSFIQRKLSDVKKNQAESGKVIIKFIYTLVMNTIIIGLDV